MGERIDTVAAGASRKLLARLGAAGVDAAHVAEELGIDVVDPDARIPVAKHHALWEVLLERVPRHDLVIELASEYSPGDYGLVGFVAMNCATLGEGLEHAVRYLRLWTDEPSVQLRADGTLAVTPSRPVRRPGARCTTEAAPVEILRGARLLTQTHLVPRDVRFAHAAPPDVAPYTAFFGCPVRFGADDTAMVFAREHLDLALPRAEPQLGAYLRTIANAALSQRADHRDAELERLRELIADELQHGVPTLPRVARRMATSTRTLRRRIEVHGSSFRGLLDETRADLARSYVRDPKIPLTEVAFLLGFSDASAFHRAFKRWTDTTPKAWRARAATTP